MDFTKEQIREVAKVLDSLRYTRAGDMKGFEYTACGYIPDNKAPEGPWEIFPEGLRFGGRDQHFWFRKSFHTPKMREGFRLYFDLKTKEYERDWDAVRPQVLVILNGHVTQGLDINHRQVLLEPDTDYDMDLYFYCGMEEKKVQFLPSLVWLDEKIEKLYYDLEVALDAAKCLPEGSDDQCRILTPLRKAVRELDLRQLLSPEFYESLDRAEECLDRELYRGACGDSRITVDCVGHTHIDVAWLWTVAQTKEKAQRSFSTVLRLMEQYPEYKFMSSQPQLYAYVKEAAPELYDQIKQRVKEGRWEVEGAMWLEADCNLPSGESLVRQVLHGKRFMKEEFGVDSRTLWLPDVFGYSAALPQILKKSGVDRFFTSKISWSETNRMPYEAFLWQGIDGTEIFTSFATAQDASKDGHQDNIVTYVGNTEPKMVLGTWNRYTDKNYTDEVMITFGYGDGGGGPTRHQLETQRRMEAGFPGFPKTRITTSGEYLDSIEKKFRKGCQDTGKTPRWVGELYLEFHRGTYTSNAKNKKNNRNCEMLLGKAELLSMTDRLLTGGAYPKAALYDSWQTVLLNQFHDIIPGSSIYEVYEECDREYAAVRKTGQGIVDEKLRSLSGRIPGQGLMVYNPLGFARSGLVRAGNRSLWVDNVPAMGWTLVEAPEVTCGVQVGKNFLENDFVRVELDEAGFITSLFDKKAGRQVVRPGARLNELQAFEDFPKEYDAWEITNYYKQKMWIMDQVTSMEPVEDGVRRGIRIRRKYLSSEICQTLYLTDHSAQLDFVTEVEWHERHQLIKAAFPVDLLAKEAAYEIQFGHLNRPTHENTSWDQAKFEVCGHKWADIYEEGYGVALLNDCKYGYNTEGSTLKLTLLKCATYPNPEADQGHHEFTYSLLPHRGGFCQAGVVQAAYGLNQPLTGMEIRNGAGDLPQKFSLASCDRENVILETVKRAEDGDDMILRLYEAWGSRTTATITFGVAPERVSLVNLMEEETGTELPIHDGTVTLPVRAFEIVTLKCRFNH